MGDEFFVGRVDELALLKDLLAELAAGVGGLVLVEGEQGIGKTSLLRRALADAEGAGCALAWGAGDELAQPLPLWLMTECLRGGGRTTEGGGGRGGDDDDAAGGAGPRLPGNPLAAAAGLVPPGDPVAAEIERVLVRVDRWCAVSPVALVAEDLQWADEASLLVWRRLARVVGQLPLLLVGSLRPGPGGDPVDRLRHGLLSRGGTVLGLGPLRPPEVSQLAGQLAGGRPGRRLARVVNTAEGNPLYARELVDALVRDGRVLVEAGVAELAGPEEAGVPASLVGTIERRLGALPQEIVRVLRWAAVLGQEFSVTDLQAVTGRTAGQLMGGIADAVTAGVFGEVARPGSAGPQVAAGTGPRLAFRHGLIRQVLYERASGAEQSELHLRAARALAAAGALPERVAAQLAAAPEWPDAWALEWLADTAPVLTYRAPSVAAELLDRALSLLPECDERREALEAAAVTVASLLMHDEKVERVGALLAGYARDPDRAAEAAWRVGYAQQRSGRAGEAVAWLDTALQRPGTSDLWTARLHALRARAVGLAGRPDSAKAARNALALAEAAGDRLAAGYALHAMSQIDFYVSRTAVALRRIEQALDVIGDDPHATDLQLTLLFRQGQGLSELDRRSETEVTIRETLALAERTATPHLPEAYVLAADCHFRVGRWDDALAMLEQAIALPNHPQDRIKAHGILALIAGHRGSTEAPGHFAAAKLVQIDSTFVIYQATAHFLLLAQALAAEQAGSPGAAVAVLRPNIDPGAWMMMRYLLLPDLVRLALANGDTETAAAAARAAAQDAEREPIPVKAAAADRCRGLMDGDPAPVLAAAVYYESASRPLERAQSLEDAAVLLARGNDRPGARQASAEAVRIYRVLGARWDIRRSEGRLGSYGVRLAPADLRPQPTQGWVALTPTEVKVARMVSIGLSNPDIAAELFISRNTVQTHVSHILAKLSARSRFEIARESLRHPAPGEETQVDDGGLAGLA
jgi:DNA-binding CsgD family transcriptional regulator